MTAAISFLGGLVLLVGAGHVLVNAASRIGTRMGLSPTLIGLTIVAGGTSAPELAVVFQSLRADDPELAVGSIIGSNIANVLLVLGLAAVIGSIAVNSRMIRVDIPFMIGATVALLVLSLDGALSRLDGILLLGALIAFIGWTIKASTSSAHQFKEAQGIDGLVPNTGTSAEAGTRPTAIGWTGPVLAFAAGIAGLAVASRFVVSGAEQIAVNLGIPELIVGLTIVALGTSAPEIVTTLVAALQGNRDLAVGNAVGSNIFNILLVLGLTSSVSGGLPFGADAIRLDLPVMVAAAIACLPMVFWDHTLQRWEGAVFVGYYLAYITFLALDGTGHWAGDPFAFVMLFFVVPLTAITVAVLSVRRRRHTRANRSSTSAPSTPSPLITNRLPERATAS